MAEAGEKAKTEDENKVPMDKQTLLAVLQFLKKNNLKDTESLLKKEANVGDEEIKDEGPTQSASEVSQALSAYKSEGDPTQYEDFYGSLRQFVERSLDVHKCELSMVLYPVFVHMYLELIYNGHENQAQHFFEKFSMEQESYYEEDLKQLATVTKIEHMKGNLLLDNFKSSKFTIRMSRDSYNHLKRHLMEKKHTKLLTIVQDHLFIDVFDGAPRSKQVIEATSGSMSGEAKKDANKSRVFYGLLKEPEISIPLDDEEEAEASGNKKKKIKKDPSLAKKARNDPNAPHVTRIPLPELRDLDKMEKIRSSRESAKRVPLGLDNMPSICQYTLLNANAGLTGVSVCEDSSLMAAGFANSQIHVWSLSQNRLRTMKTTNDLNLIDKEADDVLERMMDNRSSTENKTLLGHSGPVYSTSFTPDRSQMTSSSEDGTIRLWSLQTWTNIVCYKGHMYPVFDVKFGPYGHYFASASHDRTARLWSTDHYQPVRIFAGHLADVDCVQFHPNSNYIATGSTDRTVRLWDVSSGNCVRIMTGHKSSIHSLMFSPDGRYLASGGADKLVLLWEMATGDLVGQLKGHKDTVYSLAFSREGSILATGGLDSEVKLWDTTRLVEDQETEGISGMSTTTDTSMYELASYPTKSCPTLALHFTRRNVLLAAGPYVT